MGNQGFQGEARGPAGSVIRRKERNTAATSNLYATQQVRDNENLHHIGKPAEGYRYHTQRTSHTLPPAQSVHAEPLQAVRTSSGVAAMMLYSHFSIYFEYEYPSIGLRVQ